jgi:hypothetical protein
MCIAAIAPVKISLLYSKHWQAGTSADGYRNHQNATAKPVFHQQLIKEEDLTGIIAVNHIIYFPIHYQLLPYLEIFDADRV